MSTELDSLKAAIAQGQVVVLAGAGVSASTTNGNPLATWRGLLSEGINRTAQFCSVSPNWKQRQSETLNDGDVIDWIGVAQQIESRLQHRREFYSFIDGSMSRLQLIDPSLIRAMKLLAAPIATTNYDTLIEQALNLQSIVWEDRPHVGDWINMPLERRPILHLHGIHHRHNSIVFGFSSYSRIVNDPWTQFMQQVLTTVSSIVFIGCGSGTEDPNLAGLIAWLGKEVPQSTGRHYRLCLESERQPLLDAAKRIQPIAYGKKHSDLAAFLDAELAHPSFAVPLDIVRLAQGHDYLRSEAGLKWQERNRLFDEMVKIFEARPVNPDALKLSTKPGVAVTALLARLKAKPDTADLPRLYELAMSHPPIERDSQYKIADVVKAMLESTRCFEKLDITKTCAMLGSFRPEAKYLSQDHQQRFDNYIRSVISAVEFQ